MTGVTTYFVPSLSPTSFAQTFANTAQLAIAPALELQFFATQAAVEERMQKDVQVLLGGGTSTASETAHLTRRLAALQPKLTEMEPYASRAAANEALLKAALDGLTELRALAAPATAADFDVKRAELLDKLNKLATGGPVPLGMADDDLAAAQAAAIAAIQGIVTNGFATAGDITAAQATIDATTTDLTRTLSLVEINADISGNTVTSLREIIGGTELAIQEIESDARAAAAAKVKEKQDYYARILTSLSLSMDAAIYLTSSFADTLAAAPASTGTVVDFMA